MTTFIGFNTINQYKKFTLVDYPLVKRDLLNAFNIRQGELPGRPGYGTVLWDFLFENQIQELQTNLENEVRRVCGNDPRVVVNNVQCFPQQNGFLLQLEVVIQPSVNAEVLAIFFDLQQRLATIV